jgi:hypothetical protein
MRRYLVFLSAACAFLLVTISSCGPAADNKPADSSLPPAKDFKPDKVKAPPPIPKGVPDEFKKKPTPP